MVLKANSKIHLKRAQRIPKEPRRPLASNPPEFARVLTEKLERVKLERELHESKAWNLSAHNSEMPKKSILQQAIDNSKIPLSTIAMSTTLSPGSLFFPRARGGREKRDPGNKVVMSVVPEPAALYKDPYRTESVGGGSESRVLSTSAATVTFDAQSQQVQPQHVQRSKTPATLRTQRNSGCNK